MCENLVTNSKRLPKLKFLLKFDQNLEYPLRDFHKVCTIFTPFHDTLAVKISLDLLKGLRSYRGFKLMGSGCPQIFSAPSGETMRQIPRSL